MELISVLLVGAGGFGSFYLNEFLSPHKKEGVKLIGVVDPYLNKQKETVDTLAENKIPLFDTLENFYKDNYADLVVVASPIHLHREHVITCLENNSYVLCEKPISATVEDAEAILAAEKRAGKYVAIGYQLAFSKTVQDLKKDILAGLFGKPLSMKAIHMFRRGKKYYSRNNWAGKIIVNGTPVYDSPLANSCAHQMQNMMFLAGNTMIASSEIKKAEAKLFRLNPLVENFDAAAFRCESTENMIFNYYTNLNINSKEFGPFFEYTFENAVVKNDVENGYIAIFKNGGQKTYNFTDEDLGIRKLYVTAEYARGGNVPPCTAETAIQHTKLVNMVQGFAPQTISIKNISPVTERNDEFIYSQEFNDMLWDCYEKGILPGI